ncbi:MAG: response regulator transcription factor [Gammaproteobacteria bacterium]
MAAEQVVHAVDDDRLFLSALERTLRTAGLNVRGYRYASAFLDSLDPNPAGCLITDLRMPDTDGLELQRELKHRKIALPVIFITAHGEARSAVAALKDGAVDFLEKPFGETTLLKSVREALEKDHQDRKSADEQAIVEQRFASLSPREKEIFALVVSDLTNKQIARHLKISPRTVEHHRERLMLKMQGRSMADLITMAVLCGIHELHL